MAFDFESTEKVPNRLSSLHLPVNHVESFPPQNHHRASIYHRQT
jgi:hypothetical protein